MIDRSKFYDITLVRLTNRGINPELACKSSIHSGLCRWGEKAQ